MFSIVCSSTRAFNIYIGHKESMFYVSSTLDFKLLYMSLGVCWSVIWLIRCENHVFSSLKVFLESTKWLVLAPIQFTMCYERL